MAKRCFICKKKMDEKTGLCTNPDCVRSKPLTEKKEETAAEEKVEDKADGV